MPNLVKVEQRGPKWVATWRDPDSQRRKKADLGDTSDVDFEEASRHAGIIEQSIRARGNQVRALTMPVGHESPVTIDDLLPMIQADKDNVCRKTMDTYVVAHNALVHYFGPEREVHTIGPADAMNFRWALSRGDVITGIGPRSRPLGTPPAEATVWKIIKNVYSMFRCAHLREYTLTNPFRGVQKKFPRKLGEVEVIPLRDLWKLVYALPTWQLQNAAALCAFMGLRNNEAIKMRWKDVQFDRNRCVVCPERRAQTTKYRLRCPPIEVRKIPTGLYKFLLARSQREDRDENMVCGGLYDDALRAALVPAYKALGMKVPRQPTHALRKSWASRLGMYFPVQFVSQWMGSSISVHIAHYQGVPPEAYDPPDGVDLIPVEEDVV